MPGNFIVKASQHPFLPGESIPAAFPALPQGNIRGALDIRYAYSDMKPVVNAPFIVVYDNGTQVEGNLDDKGEARVENPPGPGRVFFGYDQRDAFAYPERPRNPIFGFRPTTPEDAREALEIYAKAEAEYMEDNYFPDEIAVIYSGDEGYDDLVEDYEYFDELAPDPHEHDDVPATHEEIVLSGNEGRPGTSA